MSCDNEPIWLDDSVSPCFSRLYLQAWPSFLAVSISVTLLEFHKGEESANKSNKLRLRRLVESALVITQLALVAATWVLTEEYQGDRRRALVFWSSASFWTYALVLVTARYVKNRDNTVWAHSAGLYLVAAVTSSIALKTAFDTASPLGTYCAQLSFSLLLFILTWSDYDGDQKPDTPLADDASNIVPSAEINASLFSRASFSFMNALLWRGKAKPLEIEDVNDLNPDMHASDIYTRFQRMSTRYPNYSFVARLLLFNRSRIALGLLFGAVHSVLEFGPTIMIKFILEYLEDPEKGSSKLAWTCVSGIFIVSLFENVFNLQSLANGKVMSITTQDVITTKIYQKSLSRKVAAAGVKKQGTIINLMSVDADKVVEVWRYFHFFISAVFELVCETIILWKLLGWPAVVGSIAGLVWTPVDYYMASWHAKLQDQFMEAADERVEKTNEVLQCIRIIKYFAWEDKFSEKVREARANELKVLGKQIWIDGIGVMVWLITPIFISGTAFGWYTLVEKRELTNAVAFTSISLFTLLHEPLTYMVDTVTAMMDARVSLRRLSEFFDEPETEKYNQLVNDGKIGFNDASFEWDNKPDSFKLRELDVKFPRDKMTVITGSTGSGKTSLLLALLGEMDLITGTVHLPNKPHQADENGLYDTVAYCAQQAWLLNDTLKSNILFGSEYDAVRYNNVIDACALRQDIQMLENGDSTLVGERGVILSGGQKQRISLARAIYSFSKHLLLDDCLSAVDSHTALKIYEDCLTGELVSGRTVILVSHNVQLALSKAHWVVQVEDGRVKYEGKPDLSAFSPPSHAPSITEGEKLPKSDVKDEGEEDGESDEEEENDDGDSGKYDETKATGSVSKRLYGAYFKKLGGVSFTVKLVLLFAVEQSAEKYKTAWLRNWSLGTRSDEFYLILYVILSMGNVIAAGVEQVYLLFQGLAASRKIYNDLLDSVLGTSIRFFDTTPVGRIINRFSKDMESIDQELPDMGRAVLDLVATIGSSALLIAWITPPFAAVLVVISGVYAAICGLYLSSSRELKRLGSITKSPILQQFGETLLGVATIRAYGHTSRFMTDNMNKTDTNMRPNWYISCVNRWLQFRIQIANAVITSGAAAFVVLAAGKLDAGFAGLSLSYAMSINQLVMYLITNYAELENQMTSVERTEEYSHLPSERFNGVQPAPSWPQVGGVKFENVSVRYAPELPVVINNLSFDIPAGSKLGVVGRTGAGKSTIITALFRLVEAEQGVITIDGEDISKLELKALRRALAIIPQDPTLFAGTLRSNLDPFDLYSDDEILESLRRVHLISEEEPEAQSSSSSSSSSDNQNVNQFKNLESTITEGGSNISQGQRQLVCLARSLLKRCKILLLDEATASIDYETDKKIQQTIREEFNDTTLITIAHRLHSIIDYDSILVLDRGEKIEFGPPKKLFDDKDGVFRSMCDKGDVTEKDF